METNYGGEVSSCGIYVSTMHGKEFNLRFQLCGVGGGKALGFQITEDSFVSMGKYPCSSDF